MFARLSLIARCVVVLSYAIMIPTTGSVEIWAGLFRLGTIHDAMARHGPAAIVIGWHHEVSSRARPQK